MTNIHTRDSIITTENDNEFMIHFHYNDKYFIMIKLTANQSSSSSLGTAMMGQSSIPSGSISGPGT